MMQILFKVAVVKTSVLFQHDDITAIPPASLPAAYWGRCFMCYHAHLNSNFTALCRCELFFLESPFNTSANQATGTQMCPISFFCVFSRFAQDNMFTASTRPALQHKDPHSSRKHAESQEEPEQRQTQLTE